MIVDTNSERPKNVADPETMTSSLDEETLFGMGDAGTLAEYWKLASSWAERLDLTETTLQLPAFGSVLVAQLQELGTANVSPQEFLQSFDLDTIPSISVRETLQTLQESYNQATDDATEALQNSFETMLAMAQTTLEQASAITEAGFFDNPLEGFKATTASVVDGLSDATTSTVDYVRQNPKQVATAVLAAGAMYIAYRVFIKDDSEGEQRGFLSRMFGTFSMGALGSTILAKAMPEGAGKWLAELLQLDDLKGYLENATGDVTEKIREEITDTIIERLPEPIRSLVREHILEQSDDETDTETEDGASAPDESEPLLGDLGGDLEWLQEVVGFDEGKQQIIRQLEDMGFGAPEWLEALSPSQLAEAINIHEIRNSTIAGRAALGFMLYHYASLRGVAINAGLYLFFIREGENSWGAEMINERLEQIEHIKDDFFGSVDARYPWVGQLLRTVDFDWTNLSIHIDELAEFAQENPITTLAAANGAWLVRGLLWSLFKKSGRTLRQSMVMALQNPITTVAAGTTLFAYREEVVDFLVDEAVPFEGAEDAREWMREQLHQLTGEAQESASANHVQEVWQSLTHEVGEAAMGTAEIAQEVYNGNIALTLSKTGKVVGYAVLAGSPVMQVLGLTKDDFMDIWENLTGAEGSEENMSTLWLTGESFVLSAFAIKGAIAYRSIYEASKKATNITERIPLRVLKSAGFPFTAEGRFLVRSMLDMQWFANLRLSGHVGLVEGLLGDIERVLQDTRLTPAQKVAKITAYAGDIDKIVPIKYADRLKTLRGFGTTHQSLKLYGQLGAVFNDLNNLRADVTQPTFDNATRLKAVTGRLGDARTKIASYRTFASDLLGRWNKILTVTVESIKDAPAALRGRLGQVMSQRGQGGITGAGTATATSGSTESTPRANTPPAEHGASARGNGVVDLADERARRTSRSAEPTPSTTPPRPGGSGATRAPAAPANDPGSPARPQARPTAASGGSGGTVARINPHPDGVRSPTTSTRVLDTADVVVNGNTVRAASPEAAPQATPRSISAASVDDWNRMTPEQTRRLQAANVNVAQRASVSLERVNRISRILTRAMAPAMVIDVLNRIASAEDVDKEVIRLVTDFTVIGVAMGTGTATLGPPGALLGLVAGVGATIVGAERIDAFVEWSDEQLFTFAKEHGVDIRTLGTQTGTVAREVIGQKLGNLNVFNKVFDPIFESMGFQFAMGTTAAAFFAETETGYSSQGEYRTALNPLTKAEFFQHGAEDVVRWNKYVQRQLADVKAKLAEHPQTIAQLEDQSERGNPRSRRANKQRIEAMQEELTILPKLREHWLGQLINDAPRQLEGMSEATTWYQRSYETLAQDWQRLQLMRGMLSESTTPLAEAMDVTDAVLLAGRNPLTTNIRTAYEATAETETTEEGLPETGADTLWAEHVSHANLFTAYVALFETLRNQVRGYQAADLLDKILKTGDQNIAEQLRRLAEANYDYAPAALDTARTDEAEGMAP